MEHLPTENTNEVIEAEQAWRKFHQTIFSLRDELNRTGIEKHGEDNWYLNIRPLKIKEYEARLNTQIGLSAPTIKGLSRRNSVSQYFRHFIAYHTLTDSTPPNSQLVPFFDFPDDLSIKKFYNDWLKELES